jgi:hypothetical protein
MPRRSVGGVEVQIYSFFNLGARSEYKVNSKRRPFYHLGRETVDRDNSVGIVTGYRLDGPGIESRWGSRFSEQLSVA